MKNVELTVEDLPPAQIPVGGAHPTKAPIDPAAPRHIPQTLLAHLTPGRAWSKAELCAALHLTPAEWAWAIRELKEPGKVVQTGERRGARYRLA